MNQVTVPNDKLIGLKSVLDQYQVSKSQWYKKISEGTAPRPIREGGRALWSQNEINDFIDGVKMKAAA